MRRSLSLLVLFAFFCLNLAATAQVTTETTLVKKGEELNAEKVRLMLEYEELETKRMALAEMEIVIAVLEKKLAAKTSTNPDEDKNQLEAARILYETEKPVYEERLEKWLIDYERWQENFETYLDEYERWLAEQDKKKAEEFQQYRREWAKDVISKNPDEESLAGIPFDQLDKKFEQWYATENPPNPNTTPQKPNTIKGGWNPTIQGPCRLCGSLKCKTTNCKGKYCTRCGQLRSKCPCTNPGVSWGNNCKYCGQNDCNEACITKIRKKRPTYCKGCGKKKYLCNAIHSQTSGQHCGICGEYDCNESCSPPINAKQCERCGDWNCNSGCGDDDDDDDDDNGGGGSGGSGGGLCFVAGTPVWTPQGLRSIEEIDVGDTIWSYDLANEELVKGVVIETFIATRDGIVDVQVGGEVLRCSENHPFYSAEGEWIKASDLQNAIFCYSGIYEPKVMPVGGKHKVYNFEVEGQHNYFVGKNHSLVHNRK